MIPIEANQAPCKFLPWDTEFFGFRVGRVSISRLTAQSVATILEWNNAQAIHCLYFSSDGIDPETLRLAGQTGFQFVDVRLDLARSLASPAANPDNGHPIRMASPSDLAQLQAIARKSHHDTRFFKDRGFPAARSEALYAEWIRRDMEVNHVLIATSPHQPDRPTGYITCQVDAAARSGRIGLIAVDDEYQGKGIGRALVLAGLNWFRTANCQSVNVATQATNLPAQRLYQAVGFRTIESSVWFHRWSPQTGERK